jgi:hypothetical protein
LEHRTRAQPDDTARNEIGLEVKLLPTGYDVDDGASLRRLCNEILADTTAADIAPYTRQFLASFVERKKLL